MSIQNDSVESLVVQTAIKRAEFLCEHLEYLKAEDEFYFLKIEHIAIQNNLTAQAQYLNFLHEKMGNFYRPSPK